MKYCLKVKGQSKNKKVAGLNHHASLKFLLIFLDLDVRKAEEFGRVSFGGSVGWLWIEKIQLRF